MAYRELLDRASLLHNETEMREFLFTHYNNSLCPKIRRMELAAMISDSNERQLFHSVVKEHNEKAIKQINLHNKNLRKNKRVKLSSIIHNSLLDFSVKISDKKIKVTSLILPSR